MIWPLSELPCWQAKQSSSRSSLSAELIAYVTSVAEPSTFVLVINKIGNTLTLLNGSSGFHTAKFTCPRRPQTTTIERNNRAECKIHLNPCLKSQFYRASIARSRLLAFVIFSLLFVPTLRPPFGATIALKIALRAYRSVRIRSVAVLCISHLCALANVLNAGPVVTFAPPRLPAPSPNNFAERVL